MQATSASAKSPPEASIHVGARLRSRRIARLVALATLGIASGAACSTSSPSGVSRTSAPLDQTVLGTAQSFAVLGGSTVTSTGPTTVDGNLGVDPGLAVTGFPPGLVTGGTIHSGDAAALQAQKDVVTAYDTLAGEAPTADLTGKDLGGMTLVAGVYHFSSSAQLTGALTLDAKGDPAAAFVFQIGSTLTTASNSSVLIVNGGRDCNVFWQVGSSATVGTTTALKGNVVALTSITLDTGAVLAGRALARSGAVTMDSNGVSISTCAISADGGVDASSGSGGGSDGMAEAAEASGLESGPDATSSGSDSAVEAGSGACCGAATCGTSCTNLMGDVGNCGACGHACASGQLCSAGLCTPCTSVCAGACADLTSDAANCGACGNACAPSESCSSGVCTPCPMTACGAACVDLGSDAANCGGCGQACAAGEACSSGACTPCASTCAGACADLSSDWLNCGACGNVCGWGHFCKSGACVCQ